MRSLNHPESRADVEILGDRELAARRADIAAVGIDIERHRNHRPEAEAARQRPLVVGPRIQVGCKLDGRCGPPRNVEHFDKVEVLGPVIGSPAQLDVVTLVAPGADGGECRRHRRGALRGPFVEQHRRARRIPAQARRRQQAIGLADIGGVGEVYAMRIEHLRHQRIAIGVAHLVPLRDRFPDRPGSACADAPRAARSRRTD